MLDGTLSATVVAGDLVLTGDGLANGATITPGNSAGEYVITGFDCGSGTTSVNGQSQVTLSGIVDDFQINLNGGDDCLALLGIEAPENDDFEPLIVPDALLINTHAGHDNVIAGFVQVGGPVNISTAAGEDNVDLALIEVGQNLTIFGGTESDHVILGGLDLGGDLLVYGQGGDDVLLAVGVSARAATVSMEAGYDVVDLAIVKLAQDLQVLGGTESDIIKLAGVDVMDDLFLHGNAGDDELYLTLVGVDDETRIWGEEGEDKVLILFSEFTDDVFVFTHAGDDNVEVFDSYFGDNLNIYTHGENDRVSLQGLTVAATVFVDTGTGEDQIRIGTRRIPFVDSGIEARNLIIYAGADSDQVTVKKSSFAERIFVSLASGDDVLEIRDNSATTAQLFGDAGFDTINDDVEVDNSFAALLQVSFEQFVAAVKRGSLHNEATT